MMQNLYKNANLYRLTDQKYSTQFSLDKEAVKLLIFVKSNKSLEKEIVELLSNIFKALKLEQNEAEIILFDKPISLSQIANEYQTNKALSFGCEASDLNLNMELSLFKRYVLSSYQLIMLPDLIDIYNTKKYKATLWNLLQEMFKL